MFCNQSRFDLPTTIVTAEVFNNLVDSAQTKWLTREHRRLREALPSILAREEDINSKENSFNSKEYRNIGDSSQGDDNKIPKFLDEPSGKAERQDSLDQINSLDKKSAELEKWARDENFIKFCQGQEASKKRGAGGKTKGEIFKALPIEKKLQTYCDNLKKNLPFVIFIATYMETASASGKMGCWRKQVACRLNGLCVIDFDHIEGDCRAVWEEAYSKLSDEDKARVLLVYITPSGHGLKVIFIADIKFNLIDNQKVFAEKLGLTNIDEVCRDASRGAFLTTREDILLINEEKLFTYENEEFGKRYNALYRNGHSQASSYSKENSFNSKEYRNIGDPSQGDDNKIPKFLDEPSGKAERQDSLELSYNGVAYSKIIEAWLEGVNLDNNRHNTLVELANHLRYLVGKNATQIEKVVMQLPWVQDLAAEGENVSSTINSVIEFKYYERMPKKLKVALEKVGALTQGAVPLHSAQQGQS